MGKGYISLFFDDSSFSLPSDNLAAAKENIFSNYQNRFQKPDLNEKQDLKDFIDNKILQGIQEQLSQGNKLGEQGKSDPIKYWDLTIGGMMSVVNKEASTLEKIQQTLEYIENAQSILSDAISRGSGKISTDLMNQLKQRKESLANIAARFGVGMTEDSFKSAFWGSLKGAVAAAQGSVHEAASAIAAAEAKQKIEKELKETNENIRIIVESTGGSLSSDLAESFEKSGISAGLANNAKSDLTIAVTDGNGVVLWTTGISLKSTSSKTPSLVKIMTQSVSTLLNKVYPSEEYYLNVAAGLGIGDWNTNDKRGIVGLAKRNNVSTSSGQLTEAWKNMIYNAIYAELINMFAGSGGALNDVQYLIINATPISLYELFLHLQSIQNPQQITSIQGVEISGASEASKRDGLVQKNVEAFKKGKPDVNRIERSSKTWAEVHSALTEKKIKISLKYAQLYGGATR